MGFKGGHEKNMALKKKGFKGGGGSFLNVILTFRKFKFYRGRMSQDPLLYYAPKGNSIPLKRSKKHTSIPNRTFH